MLGNTKKTLKCLSDVYYHVFRVAQELSSGLGAHHTFDAVVHDK